MKLHDLISKTRTVRRYQENRKIDNEVLMELVDLARLAGSAGNKQPLRYMIITDEPTRAAVYSCLGWAGYLTDWPGPDPGERPAAYIICLIDTVEGKGWDNMAYCDLGIATQNLLIGAAERGIFGCRIASISQKLADMLNVEKDYRVLLVLALGYPAEDVVLEAVGENGDIKYWRDDSEVHHVPKRRLEDILVTPGKHNG